MKLLVILGESHFCFTACFVLIDLNNGKVSKGTGKHQPSRTCHNVCIM